MRIKLIGNGETTEVEDSWGERLIEHGKALPAAPEAEKPKAEEAGPEPEREPEAEAPEPQTEPAAKPARKKR